MADPGPRPSTAQGSPDAAAAETDAHKRIVRSARRVFERIPFRYVTVADLCAAAQVGPDTFHAHFDTVGDVMAEAYDEIVGSMDSLYVSLGEAITQPDRQGMAAWIDAYLTRSEENRDVLRAIREASVLDPSFARHMQTTMDRTLNEVVGPFGHLSTAQRTEALNVVRMLMTQLSQATLEWVLQGADRTARGDLIRSQTTIWTGSLRAF